MDLNIIRNLNDKDNVLRHVVERAFEFGFECVAINTVIDSSKLSGKNISIPEPTMIDFSFKSSKKFRIVNRITAIIKDSIHSHHFLKSPVTKKYDILALQPVGEKMLQHICSTLDVDVISLNLTGSLGYTLKKSSLNLAISKGACFEITYAPCLRDQTAKRMVISNAQLLVDVTKGRNIILSSGACKPLELRGVEDVINLGMLFGLSRDKAAATVRKTCQTVLSHAGTRNETGCGFVSLTGMFRLPKHQGWIVSACKVPKLSEGDQSTSKKRSIGALTDLEDKMKKKTKLSEN